MKKKLSVSLVIVTTLLLIVGCGKKTQDESVEKREENKVAITMYLWDKNMTKALTPWLEEKFPEYDINFVIGYNNMDYYKDMAEKRGELPDIITCRRFSLNDAEALSEMLVDFSTTDIASTFYPSYIEYNREHDGAIRWLPMCAVVDGFVANLDLFEEYGIEIPTDYASFIDALNKFEEKGIRGFAADYFFDYTCLEILQGTSIPTLTSLDGAIWRKEYESGNIELAKEKEESIWPEVFAACMNFLEDTKARSEDNLHNFQYFLNEFKEGRIAMYRATAHDATNIKELNGINTAMLPYFGESENDNWILTYPMFQVAVNSKVKEDPEKERAVMNILSAMFSKEGQMKAACDISFLSYNKTVDIEPTDVMKYIIPEIESNHLYMRLASTEMFSISKKVVQKMVNGEIDEEKAYNEFSYLLSNKDDSLAEDVVMVQDESYPLSFGENGNEAASAVLNTIRSAIGSDIAISYSSLVSSPIFKGEYTLQEIKWILTFNNPVYFGKYTGEEIKDIMSWLINTNIDGANPIRHKNSMPVTSGMEYEIQDNGDGTYTLLSLRVDNEPIVSDKEYSLAFFGLDLYLTSYEYCNSPMPQWLEEKREGSLVELSNNGYLLEGIKENGRILPPTSYVTINSAVKP
ncbi:MAG: extracellular solute-binding protein [Candidatus Ornithospirochaeta sp.]